jgi:hypothetical protein
MRADGFNSAPTETVVVEKPAEEDEHGHGPTLTKSGLHGAPGSSPGVFRFGRFGAIADVPPR